MSNGVTSPFRVGHVLERGFAVFFRNIVIFSLIALLFILPSTLLFELESLIEDEFNQILFLFGLLLLSLILGNIATAVIAYGTFQDMHGKRASIGDYLSRGLELNILILGVAFLSAFAITLGTGLLVVPGFIVMTILWVAIPVAVVERPGISKALRRSAELTKGYRWQVFGIIAILMSIDVAILLIVDLPDELDLPLPSSMGAWKPVLSGVLEALVAALAAVMATVVYHDLRVAKEGIGITDIAKVFD